MKPHERTPRQADPEQVTTEMVMICHSAQAWRSGHVSVIPLQEARCYVRRGEAFVIADCAIGECE